MWALYHKWVAVFLMHSIKSCMFNHSTRVFNHLTCVFTQLACSSLYLIVTGLLTCTWALTQAAYIANTLWVLIACYVFIRVRHAHYLSSSNSPVNFRIGNHICKGRGLILLVTGLQKSTVWLQITRSSIFASIFHSDCSIPFL